MHVLPRLCKWRFCGTVGLAMHQPCQPYSNSGPSLLCTGQPRGANPRQQREDALRGIGSAKTRLVGRGSSSLMLSHDHVPDLYTCPPLKGPQASMRPRRCLLRDSGPAVLSGHGCSSQV